MPLTLRQAALCVFRRGPLILLTEIPGPRAGTCLHRPPGGGIEAGETPEQAVRREVLEELGIVLAGIHPLGPIDHTWFCNGRETPERAWIFQSDPACDPRLARGDTLDLLEADGQRFRTVWRSLTEPDAAGPPVCPDTLLDLLRRTTAPAPPASDAARPR